MPPSLDSLNEIAKHLESHEESLRIKKLLFCVCKKYWENDPNILNNFPIKSFVQEILQSTETLEQLKLSLYKVVKTLNRPNTYAEVTKFTIDKFSQLYPDKNSDNPNFSSQINAQETQVFNSDFLIDKIVNNLTHHQEAVRIKKLIFSICKNRWENDQARIENYNFKKLIWELYQLNPTKETLKISLNKIVGNLNKQNLYLIISKIIFNYLEPLYSSKNNYIETEIETVSQVFSTQIIHVNNAFSTPQHCAVASDGYVEQAQDYSEVEVFKRRDFETSIIDLSAEQVVTELKYVQQVQPTARNKPYDPFELRLEIMQYTNPLRAKILLFSIIYHPWDKSGQDWSMLRSYTLNDLFEQLMLTGKTLTEIEPQLYAIAKSMTDTDANLQTASTIIEALKPLF